MKKVNQAEQQLKEIRERLHHSSDVVYYPVTMHSNTTYTFIFMETIINTKMFHQHVLQPFLSNKNEDPKKVVSGLLEKSLLPIPTESTTQIDLVVQSISQGKVALITDQQPIMFLMKITEYQTRSVPDSQNEIVIIGPHTAFNESLQTNLSLLRHHIKHPNLKSIKYTLGKYTQTEVNIVYMEGKCDPQLLLRITKMIERMKGDRVIGSSFISEQLEINRYSPFPQIQVTERPDTVATSLLEGRIGIMVDGTPIVLLLPVTFFTLLLSTEDYHQNFLAATWIRWIRFLFVIVSFLLPSTYVALTTFHPHMIPTDLLITITAAREQIPFPTIVEALMMELLFEALREAGIRIPQPIGQTISIIGAIVIGQATVQAGIVSAPIVIVVSITGIASYIIPHYELSLAFRLLRFPVMIMGGMFGLLGIITSVYTIYAHLISLKSFGIPYMQPFAPVEFKQWRDVFIRAPWNIMRKNVKPYGNQEEGG